MEMNTLRKEMDDLFVRFFGELPLSRRFRDEWMPRVDVTEDKNDFVVKVELPGLDAKDVNITITEEVLTIKGEKKNEAEKKDEQRYYAERYYGSFERSFRLPAGVKSEKADATFDKGVLKIKLPKKEQAKQKDSLSRIESELRSCEEKKRKEEEYLLRKEGELKESEEEFDEIRNELEKLKMV